jgi:hypothetical protein
MNDLNVWGITARARAYAYAHTLNHANKVMVQDISIQINTDSTTSKSTYSLMQHSVTTI